MDLRSLTPGGDTRPYRRWRAYGESKLANLLFMLELQRRSMAADLSLTSVAAHPGYTETKLQQTGPAMGGPTIGSRALLVLNKAVGAVCLARRVAAVDGGYAAGARRAVRTWDRAALRAAAADPGWSGCPRPPPTPPSPAGSGRPARRPPASASPNPPDLSAVLPP